MSDIITQEDEFFPLVGIKCGACDYFKKIITRTFTFFSPTDDPWPPQNFPGLTQAQRQNVADNEATNRLPDSLGLTMQEAARLAVENDPNIKCNDCIRVGENPIEPCKRNVPAKPPIVLPDGGLNGAPDPAVTNAMISGGSVSGVAGWNITAKYSFMYNVKVECDKENCRCTGCGQHHTNPDQ